jgi:hypothetical protein
VSHWIYNGKPFKNIPEEAFGFIYRITDKKSKRKYIGRKYFFSTRRVKQAGKTRRKVVTKESDWQTYTGSSTPLNESIAQLGMKNFTFEIIAIGYTKGQVNFLEETIHHKLDVLIDPAYYNDSIGSRRFIGVKIDDKFREAIKSIVL